MNSILGFLKAVLEFIPKAVGWRKNNAISKDQSKKDSDSKSFINRVLRKYGRNEIK